jgi:curved DNA-binding protein CbpA
MSTLYHVLGLPQGASHEQVKVAFRALARRFHPDVNAGSDAAEQRFKEVSGAYETLADPSARAAYDRALVCRAAEMRRRRWTFAATAATTFALTTGAIGLGLWWTQVMGGPEPSLPDAVGRGPIVAAQEAKWASAEAKGPTDDLATREVRGPEPVRASLRDAVGRDPIVAAQEAKWASAEAKGPTDDFVTASLKGGGRGSGWATYHNARFGFALRYPADVFAYDVGSSENVRNFVSRDGAKLHIFGVDNVAGTTLTRYRRARMAARYAGAVFDNASVPQRKFGFVLSGRQRGSAFYERVTFACDGRSIHGWQMIFPVSRRTLYDLVADEVDRTYTPSVQCSEPLSSAAGQLKAGTTVSSGIRKKKSHRFCWLKHGYYWKCDYHHYR